MKSKKETSNTEKKEFYEHKPYREFKASLSKDRKYWIFRDITIHVVPCDYLRKVESTPIERNDVQLGCGVKKMDGRNAKGN